MARPSETLLAIGLSRKTCLPAAAAALVVARCTSFGVVLMIASISRIGQHRLVARGRPAAIFCREASALVLRAGVAAADLELARALDGVGQNVRPPSHPDASHAQRTAPHFAPQCLHAAEFVGRHFSFPFRADRLHGHFGDPQIGLPVAAAHADAADAFAVDHTGTPPSIAVQRSGPAASASPIAWLTSRS